MFDLDQFIGKYVTKRPQSMFIKDIENNKESLAKKIEGKSVLVVGGAGSIGSSFIKVGRTAAGPRGSGVSAS